MEQDKKVMKHLRMMRWKVVAWCEQVV
ncbi:hypothetical protein A2U01_0111266, partial [Trifolium medium]|nr:hypothetical protein [Trifolium medium]